MQKGILTEDKNETLLQKVYDRYIKDKGFENVKANLEDFETPAKLSRPDGDHYIPDITVERFGTKSYFEVAAKTPRQQLVASKWMLLSRLAKKKNGNFILIVPHGNFKFASQILDQHDIDAKLIKLEK